MNNLKFSEAKKVKEIIKDWDGESSRKREKFGTPPEAE